MMAETNAKREARRRRILENSENRLRRITGRSPNNIKDKELQVENNAFKAELNFEEDNVRNGMCNIRNNTKLQDSKRFDDTHGDFLNDTSDEDIYLSEQVSKRKFTFYTLLLHRINLILLAGFVNILLVLKLDHLFGQTIIFPFLLLMIVRLYSFATIQESQKDNLLFMALILCNIKPKLIYIFKISFTLFMIILNDLGLYIFTFVLMRYIIIHYYYYDI